MSKEQQTWFTLEDVANRLGVSKSLIESFVYDRKDEPRRLPYLESTKIGGKVIRVYVEHLERWERNLAGTPSALDSLPLLGTNAKPFKRG